jgi:hypothetical protein
VAVDGVPWQESFDMVWDPVFTPSGEHVLAKVERDGRYAVAVDGRVWSPYFDALWDPVVAPDGRKVLIRAMEDGVYLRQVAALDGAVRG